MGTPRDVTWWEAPCRWDWFIPSICSAVVPTDPVQPAPHASPCTHSQTPTSCRALLTLRIGPIPPRCGNFICKTFPESFHRYPIEFRQRCELIVQWVIPHAVSIRRFLLTFWPWVIAVRTTRHFFLNPQITSRIIWTASFRCLTEYSGWQGDRLRDNVEWTASIKLRSCC